MTPQEIITMQREQTRLRELAKTLPEKLRDPRYIADALALMRDAADVIEWQVARLDQLRRDLNDEIREAQRSAGEAYSEGFAEGRGFER